MAKITEAQHQEKAVFVGVIKQNDDERQIMEYLDELEFLAETAGAVGVKKFIQKVDRPDSRTYIRSGKLQEIREYCEEEFEEYSKEYNEMLHNSLSLAYHLKQRGIIL